MMTYTTFVTSSPTPTPSAASLQNSNGIQRSGESNVRTTVIAIAAPIASVALIGAAFLFMYKKKLGCFGHARSERRGSLLDDTEIRSWRTAEYQDKFDPARNY